MRHAGRMGITVYGIRNCDTVKKARAWLDAERVAYEFHDFKALGVDRAVLAGWVAALGWEVVLNRAGTTFRGLAAADKADLDAARAIDLMAAQPAMVKRPVLVGAGILMVGFKPENYAAALGSLAWQASAC